MNWDPLFSAPNPIPPHAIAAILAFVIGGLQLALPKGTLLHRGAGWFWVSLMLVVALSALFIPTTIPVFHIGHFGPIHILSIVTLHALWQLIRFARAGEIKKHRNTALQIYFLALVITGLATFAPGRIMWQVAFGG